MIFNASGCQHPVRTTSRNVLAGRALFSIRPTDRSSADQLKAFFLLILFDNSLFAHRKVTLLFNEKNEFYTSQVLFPYSYSFFSIPVLISLSFIPAVGLPSVGLDERDSVTPIGHRANHPTFYSFLFYLFFLFLAWRPSKQLVIFFFFFFFIVVDFYSRQRLARLAGFAFLSVVSNPFNILCPSSCRKRPVTSHRRPRRAVGQLGGWICTSQLYR